MQQRALSPYAMQALAALILLPYAVSAQSQPQRTMVSSSPNPAAAPAPDPVDNMLRPYREMWQKMTPAQQKAFLDSGGSTPEQYERTLRTKGAAALPASAAPGAPAGRQTPADPKAAVNALDSLTTSLQDLNAIRDGNLSRVQKDGCPPEVTSRLADLRGKLQQDETALTGVEAPAPAAVPSKERPGAADPMAIANDWYKRAPQDQPEASAAARNSTDRSDSSGRESQLLSDVLSGAPAAASAAHRIDPKSPEALEKQKALEAEIARIKAEMAQLSGACASLKP